MKKIRIKMAEMAPVTAKDIPMDGASKNKKWYKALIEKIIPIHHNQSYEDPAEKEKEITAEVIENLIEKKQYEHASKGLIELEHKNFSGLEEAILQEKELESLYDKLKAEIFQVIKQSLTNTDKGLLQQAVQAIVEQESEDSKFNPDLKNVNRSRPKEWKKVWEQCISQTVKDQFNDLQQEERVNESPSIIATLTSLGKIIKNDLIHVVTYLKDCYPEEFDVCNSYAKHYHHYIKIWIEDLSQFETLDKDNYLLLCYVQNLYPNEILKNPKLCRHIDDSLLGSLLPQNSIRHLENYYLNYETDCVNEQMKTALDIEVELWKEGNEPRILHGHYHSELHIDIIQCYTGGLKKASEIQPEVEDRLASILALKLEEFLRRYKKLFGEYTEKNKTQQFYSAICIAQLNCCLYLREFLFRKESKLKESAQLEMLSLILQLEDSIYDALLQELFIDLRAQFKKMSQGSSPFSYQTMKSIIRTSEDFMKPFNTLMDESYKVLSGKIHLYLVKEYMTRILKRRVSNKTVQQMQTFAKQICEHAELIDSFSSFYRSCEDWLKPALPRLAEIIRLQDLNAIQLEVAVLTEAYPDIRNKQIEAILSMKGNLSRNETKLILKTADTVQRTVNEKQKLFELIKTP